MRYKRRSFKPLILSAGMPRSGSTLLFNVLRAVLHQKYGQRLTSGWVDDFRGLPRGRAYLIKTHVVPEIKLWRPRFTFYSYRDVRTAAVSGLRMFGRQITKESVTQDIGTFLGAREHADLLVSYEELTGELEYAIARVAECLKIKVDSVAVAEIVKTIRPPETGRGHESTTLLHPGHVTGTTDDDWKTIIPVELAEWINTEYRWWFEECGYPIQ